MLYPSDGDANLEAAPPDLRPPVSPSPIRFAVKEIFRQDEILLTRVCRTTGVKVCRSIMKLGLTVVLVDDLG